MKLIVEIPDEEYKMCKLLANNGMSSTAIQRILNGTLLPEGAEILTKEAYSDLCLRASRIPCYLDSPCEYQNEDVKIPCEERRWIPVSERLPENNPLCLYTVWGDSPNDKLVIISDLVEECKEHFIAWMPLPKPYEEGAEE